MWNVVVFFSPWAFLPGKMAIIMAFYFQRNWYQYLCELNKYLSLDPRFFSPAIRILSVLGILFSIVFHHYCEQP